MHIFLIYCANALTRKYNITRTSNQDASWSTFFIERVDVLYFSWKLPELKVHMNFSDRLLFVISRSIRLWRVKYIQKKNPFPSKDNSDSKTTFMTLWNNVSLDKGKVTHIFQEEIIMNSKSEGKKPGDILKSLYIEPLFKP